MPLYRLIEDKTGVKTENFILFYNNLDRVRQLIRLRSS